MHQLGRIFISLMFFVTSAGCNSTARVCLRKPVVRCTKGKGFSSHKPSIRKRGRNRRFGMRPLDSIALEKRLAANRVCPARIPPPAFLRYLPTAAPVCPKYETDLCSRLRRGKVHLNAVAEREQYESLEPWRSADLFGPGVSFDHSFCSVLPVGLLCPEPRSAACDGTGSARANSGPTRRRGVEPRELDGNVIAPIGADLAVVKAVVSYSQGRGVARWAVTACGPLVVSGLTRLIEFWIQNGAGGVQ